MTKLETCNECGAEIRVGVGSFIHSSSCNRGCHGETWNPMFAMACDCTKVSTSIRSNTVETEISSSEMPDHWK